LAYAQEDDVLDEEADVASEDEEIEAVSIDAYPASKLTLNCKAYWGVCF